MDGLLRPSLMINILRFILTEKKQRYKKVNTAFLGCKIESGNHEVKIIYHAPGTTTGKVLSLIGIAGFVLVLVQEKRKQKIIQGSIC
ncbi:MAG: hypothetical protein ACLU80_06430 [Dorea sp.]